MSDVVKKGWLQCNLGWFGKWKPKFVVLNNETLRLSDNEKNQNATHILDLTKFSSVKSSTDRTHKAYSFDVYDSNSVYAFVAKSTGDKDDWIRHIGKVLLFNTMLAEPFGDSDTNDDFTKVKSKPKKVKKPISNDMFGDIFNDTVQKKTQIKTQTPAKSKNVLFADSDEDDPLFTSINSEPKKPSDDDPLFTSINSNQPEKSEPKEEKNEISKQSSLKNAIIASKDNQIRLLQSRLTQTEALLKTYIEKHENVKLQQKSNDQKKDADNQNRCQIKFEQWLIDIVKLPQYLQLFEGNEYNDIRLIEFFDRETIENEIGIKKKLHCKLLLKMSNQFRSSQIAFNQRVYDKYKQLREYKPMFEGHGILTAQDFKNNINNKHDLINKLNITDQRAVNLIWQIMNSQQQHDNFIQENNEGHILNNNATPYL
eukprot:349240_1